MLNHQHLTPIEWETNETKIVIKHCGKSNLPAKQQVFNNYGAKSNGEFLLGYGFCLVNNLQYDTVLVRVGISQQDPLYQEKLDAIQQQGLPTQCQLNARQLSTELQQIMRIAVMDRCELQDIQHGSLEYINVENELTMMEAMERLLQHSLQKLLLAPPSENIPESINARHAVMYRNGQRHIFEMYLNTFLPDYQTLVIQQHAEEFAPYVDEDE